MGHEPANPQQSHRTANIIVLLLLAAILAIAIFVLRGYMTAGHYEFSATPGHQGHPETAAVLHPRRSTLAARRTSL